jgi:hypothetical protein
MKLPARRGSAALIERALGFYSNIEKKLGRQYALTDPLVRAAQGHREGEKTRPGDSRTERYRCRDDARDTRTKSKLPAVAALCRRDLKNDLLKSGHRRPSDEVTWTRVSLRWAGDLVHSLFDGTPREADSGDSLTTADAFATTRTPHPSILLIRIATRLLPDK